MYRRQENHESRFMPLIILNRNEIIFIVVEAWICLKRKLAGVNFWLEIKATLMFRGKKLL